MAVLDLGQPGGTRFASNHARFTVRVQRDPMRVRTVEHAMAQLAGKFQDNLGYDGQEVRWSGTIVATTTTFLNAILADLDAKITGHRRAASGLLLPADLNEIRETKLTDFDGTVISDRARIRSWTPRGERSGQGKILTLEVVFIALV
ncbi:MAG: hypothetical protein J5J06_05625 [Phycisphaerae bacterium]|nr:hypothetical protein [Phycisphaerae bacterium]